MVTYYAIRLASGEYLGRMTASANFSAVAAPFRHETTDLAEARAIATMRPDAAIVDSTSGEPIR